MKTSVFMSIPTPSTKNRLLIGIPSTNCRGPGTNPRPTICTIGIPRKVKGIDEQLDITIKSISVNEVNKMLKKIDKKRYKGISSVLEEELTNIEDRKKTLIQEIDDVYTLDFLEPSFKDLERIKKPTPYMIVEMMEEWVAVSNLDEYLYNNYPKDWSAIQDIIFFNLRDELLNAHHTFHQESKFDDDYGLNEMAFYF